MRHFLLLTGLLILIIYSCDLNKSAKIDNQNIDSLNKDKYDNDSLISNDKKEILSPDSVVFRFLKWHTNHWDKIESFYRTSDKNDSNHMINGRWGDSSMYYSVNFKGTEKFLRYIKSSKCVSEKFINDKRVSFIERNTILTDQKQWDGPPQGFSADEIFLSNETEDIISLLLHAKINVVDSSKNRIKLEFVTSYYPVNFVLSKYNKNWLIDSIK